MVPVQVPLRADGKVGSSSENTWFIFSRVAVGRIGKGENNNLQRHITIMLPMEKASWETIAAATLFVGAVIVGLSSAGKTTSGRKNVPSKAQVLALRQRYFSKSLSVSYANSGALMILEVSSEYICSNGKLLLLSTQVVFSLLFL